MTRSLSPSTKLKLIIPLLYALVSLVYIAARWPDQLQAHHIIGAALVVASFALWILARVQLGNAFTLAPEAKFLVKSGMYSKLRHPVYYFSIGAVAGLAIFSWHVIGFALLAALVLLEAVRIRKEEAILRASFGAEYEAYRALTWF